MMKSRYSDCQIITILKQVEAGSPIPNFAASLARILNILQCGVPSLAA